MAHLSIRSDWALVLACLGTYLAAAAQVRSGGGETAFSVALTVLTQPVIAGANAVGDTWELVRAGQRSLVETSAELGRVRLEAAELRRSNQLLTAESAALRQASILLQSLASPADGCVLARVTARDVVNTHTMTLDRGSRDGIRLDAPVLGDRGVLGRVSHVSTGWSRVQLLTHPNAAAAARIAGVEPEALLLGGNQPRLTSLPPYTVVAAGALVATSGSEGIYPPGLLLGVTGEASTDGLFTVVPVTLAAHASDAIVVLVLAPHGRSGP